MKFMNLLFVLLLLASASCATFCPGLYQYHKVSPEKNYPHVKTYPVYVEQSFSPKEMADINATVSEWNNVLNGYMKFEIDKDLIDSGDIVKMSELIEKIGQTHEGLMVLGLNHDDPLISDTVDEYDGTLAFVNALGDRAHFMVVIRDRIGMKDLHKILLHEFGHAMGGMHVNAQSLMYPYYSYMQMGCVDLITMLQVANYHHLDPKHLNYCSTPNLK